MISNVFLLEDFIFAEYTGMICLGIFFDTLAARYVLKAINQKKVSYYLLGILCGILGMNGHQGNFAILVVISVLCSPTLWKNLKSFIINNLVIVMKMALYWDENVTGLAPDISGYGAVNERVMSNDWAAPLALQCLDGHVLQQTEPSQEVYEQYFKGKDWLHMEEEQMIIIGDTLHLCAY